MVRRPGVVPRGWNRGDSRVCGKAVVVVPVYRPSLIRPNTCDDVGRTTAPSLGPPSPNLPSPTPWLLPRDPLTHRSWWEFSVTVDY
jgi:hypothetical protein